MNPVYEKWKKCVEIVQSKVDFKPRVALVLGSGLGDYADTMKVEAELSYKEIEGFPVPTVEGREGKFIFGYVGETPVVCMKGRVHYYEGYDISDVVLPVRVMAGLGAKILFLTNASGGIGPGYKAGDLMLIKDQIAYFLPSPIRGENIPEWGIRFPDMSNVYDEKLRLLAKKKAAELDIPLLEGVYFQTKGPQYETPAEVNFCRAVGADAVGMSTGVEAIAAIHMGMKIIGVSCISNLAAGISPVPLSDEEVIEVGKSVSATFEKLVSAIIKEL